MLYIRKLDYLKKFLKSAYGYVSVSISYGTLLNDYGNYFGKKVYFSPKWKYQFNEILRIALIVDDSQMTTRKKGGSCVTIDKAMVCRGISKSILDISNIDVEKTFFGYNYPDYSNLDYRQLLYDICASIIVDTIFNNRNYNEEIKRNAVTCFLYNFLKCKGYHNVIMDDHIKLIICDAFSQSKNLNRLYETVPIDSNPENEIIYCSEQFRSIVNSTTNIMNSFLECRTDKSKLLNKYKTKKVYFSGLRKSVFGTKSISKSKDNGELNNMNDDFKHCDSFSLCYGKKYQEMFALSLKDDYKTNFRKPEEIIINFNKFIGKNYGVDLIKTCEENCYSDKCSDLMIRINNEIITPTIFGNDNPYVYDDMFFIDIPQYLEEQNLKCYFSSSEAEFKYKHKNVFLFLGKEFKPDLKIASEAEKAAVKKFNELPIKNSIDYFDQIYDMLHTIMVLSDAIDNIVFQDNDVKLIENKISSLNDTENLVLFKTFLPKIPYHCDWHRRFKLTSPIANLYNSYEYLFLLFFIEKVWQKF